MRDALKISKLKPIKNNVFVEEMDSGIQTTKSGIILLDSDMKESGIKPRWSRVYAVGPDVDDLVPGQWVLVKHGRWTQGIDLEFEDGSVKVWRVEYPESVELVCDEDPRMALPIR